jgi:hypothetical protein
VAGGIARGIVRLYQFAPPDKKRPVVVFTRDSAVPYLSTVTVAPITSIIRGVPSEVLLKEDDGMKNGLRRELAQRSHRVARPTGKTRGPSKLRADRRDLRRIAVRPRLRRESILARIARPADSTKSGGESGAKRHPLCRHH